MLSTFSTSWSPALEAVIQRVARAGLAQHLQPLGVQHEVRIAALVDALGQLLFGLVVAIELVEADVVRPHALGFADVPFAGEDRRVAGLAEQLRQRDLVGPGFLVILSPARIGRVRPVRTGRRPVRIAERVGVQVGCE